MGAPSMQQQQKHVEVIIQQPPSSNLETISLLLGIVLTALTIGGYFWKRGTKHVDRRSD